MNTRCLNLDGMFIPVPAPEIRFKMMKFSGGELHIKIRNNIEYDEIDKVIITHRLRNMDDLMAVLIAKDALELKGVKRFDLIIPYIPYARQDRKCAEGESFTLKVFADLLNSANFGRIICFDAHSSVATNLINKCVSFSNIQYVERAVSAITKDEILLISPDKGARDKSCDLFNETQLFSKLISCEKKRNPEDGSLSGFKVLADDLNGQDCIIVDDICDGGGTFLGLAGELKKKNCGKIYLFVTHGIFSKGVDILSDVFEEIFTTNSFSDIEHKNLRQFKIKM